jgi:L-lactate dehydrogenase (cytochrome)
MPFRTLVGCHNIEQLRMLARRRLPRPIFHYLDGGAESEETLQRNTSAFEKEVLIPRCLVDVSSVRTSISLLGQTIEWPVICSPTGASRLYHPDGELAVARAAARAGTFYSLSVAATHSLEAVASVSGGPKLFQLLIFKDRALTRELVERCRVAGYDALCVTVDAAVRGKREREMRRGRLIRFAAHPRWLVGQLRSGRLSMPNVGREHADFDASARYLLEQLDPSASWHDVQAIAAQWNGALVIKGILSQEDARSAAESGATAVMVSNHGGRQLDGAASPIEMLPEVVAAVGHRVEVILDGGVRRGVHVLKALARGAKACSIGRPYLFGLGAGGEAGVDRALAILRSELVRAMQLSGCQDVNEVKDSLTRRL